ncbi:hypothetical protein EKL97_14590 [Flavobacterium sp. LS1P28]|uniref:hypothetical protein n=1 Tax=Flavobacterium sp. LS1P28 TaxID=2497752 RepID=UPI000F83E05C|nr:hypothetical protein [Flavobacterium sp. LS1P28]RTY78012.1 hypothetical protein EKL97_14590 [Flavobacterium sp. LS1P28]
MFATEYTQAMNYEMLIRNAFNCQRGTKNGADLSYMKNVMTMERGETFAKHLGSYEKQFEKVKSYISKTLLKLTKTKPYSKEMDFFNSLNVELEYSKSTIGLMKIVNSALEKVIELKGK